MDDTCAVCAETLEWTAYGACGHKDVCSTCVARLRFICNDRRCCICKTESDVVFVTKALGDYTATISDFSVLPVQPKEGRVGSYWYHEDTQAFFDDVDHYKMIKAMCKLSCSVCENMDDQDADASKRRLRFRNIDQLKGHLFHQHKLHMCSLCLEGRKIFICEQKLYTRPQLNQHISTGDSEVDGDESDRGGFSGHPTCEFCRTPFYGDNELYTHMSTEHYTCHICQRQHPGQYEYYKNYDDLEMHFRRDHFLCEDETCLAKKFIVFQSEAEFKRHNTLEHGGRMSRSKRNAALQIPTSFRYRRSNEQDNHRGRGRSFRRDIADDDLSMAIEASLNSAASDDKFSGLASSNGQTSGTPGETSDVDPLSSAFESLATTDSETPSRYRQAVSQNSRNEPLLESSFPPLPVAPTASQTKSNLNNALKNTMAARIRKQNTRNMKASSSDSARPVNSRMPAPAAVSTQPAWPVLNSGSGSSSGTSKPVADVRPVPSAYSNPKKPTLVLGPSSTGSNPPSHTPRDAWPTLSSSSGSSSASGPTKSATANGSMSSSYSSSTLSHSAVSHDSFSETYGLSKNRGSKGKIGHSASAPNLDNSGSFSASAADFPPVSVTQGKKLLLGNPVTPKIEDVRSANKSLVERMQIALDFNQDRYSAFKDISKEYRLGLLDAESYLAYVVQFGLSHLVPELAQLCPDAQKQKELIEIYRANIGGDGSRVNGRSDSSHSSGSKNRKDKHVSAGDSNVKDDLADSIISTVRKLQSSIRPSEEDVEVLTKDGYRSTKGKEKLVNESRAEKDPPKEPMKPKGQPDLSACGGSVQKLGDSEGRNKQRKKTSKFLRVRLGDGSAAALLDYNSDPEPDTEPGLEQAASDGLPVRGPWRNGGGQKLVASAKKK